MTRFANSLMGNWKPMKTRVFALAGMIALGLAACNNSNPDTVNNAELNQPSADQLNALSSDAANDAANAQAVSLGNQQNQLEDENAAAVDNTTNPTDEPGNSRKNARPRSPSRPVELPTVSRATIPATAEHQIP